MSARVVLADDHAVVRESMRIALDSSGGIEVVGEAGTGAEALELVGNLRPDVLIIDVGMPDLNGIDATRRIIKEYPQTRVIGLSAHTEERIVLAMFEAGATGYAVKSGSLNDVVKAVRAVAGGKKYLSAEIAGGLLTTGGKMPSDPTAFSVLTERERQVVQLLSEGHSSKEVAKIMSISPATVDTHRRNIMRKLELHGVAELTRFAFTRGVDRAVAEL